jgi:hypothetical protein
MLETRRNQIRAADGIIRNTSGDVSKKPVVLTPPSTRALKSRSASRQLFREHKYPAPSPSPSPSLAPLSSPSYASITRPSNTTTVECDDYDDYDDDDDYDNDGNYDGNSFYYSDDDDEACTVVPLATASSTPAMLIQLQIEEDLEPRVFSQRTDFLYTQKTGWRSRQSNRICFYGGEINILRTRVPTKDELNVVEIVQQLSRKTRSENDFAYFGNDADGKPMSVKRRAAIKKITTSEQIKAKAFSRHNFLQAFKADIMNEFPDSKIVPINTDAQILHRFEDACEYYNCFPEVGFHGSRQANFDSIMKLGVLNPALHEFIPSNIQGAYTTKLGNGNYSKSYTDTEDVFVVGIVKPIGDANKYNRAKTSTSNNNHDADDNDTTNGPVEPTKRKGKMVGQHREHQKPASAVAPKWSPPTSYKPALRVDDHNGVRVIHDESLIAPLFLAKGAYSKPTSQSRVNSPTVTRTRYTQAASPIPINNNRKSATPWVGRRRTLVDDSVVWLPPQPLDYFKHYKRRVSAKQRHLSREYQRKTKQFDLQGV